MIKQLRAYLPTNVLDQIYKMHARSHLDYCDFIYHIPELKEKKKSGNVDGFDEHVDKENSNHDLEDDPHTTYLNGINIIIQYQAGLAVTGAWKGSIPKKSMMNWVGKPSTLVGIFDIFTQFFKIINGLTPQYLVDPVPVPRRHFLVDIPQTTFTNLVIATKSFLTLFTQILSFAGIT